MEITSLEHKRFCCLCKRAGIILAAGLFYAWICSVTGRVWIPCLFHICTGWYCPGCGVSHMCLSLLKLDFYSAFRANEALFLMLPFGAVLAFRMGLRYIRTGNTRLTKGEQWLVCGMIVILLIFGILRNLPSFSYLAPH